MARGRVYPGQKPPYHRLPVSPMVRKAYTKALIDRAIAEYLADKPAGFTFQARNISDKLRDISVSEVAARLRSYDSVSALGEAGRKYAHNAYVWVYNGGKL